MEADLESFDPWTCMTKHTTSDDSGGQWGDVMMIVMMASMVEMASPLLIWHSWDRLYHDPATPLYNSTV